VVNLIEQIADEALLECISVAASEPGDLVLLANAEPFRAVPKHLAGRWARALEGFETVRAIEGRQPRPALGASLDPGPLTPRTMSRARYERLWEESDETERRVLGQLAVDGYANPTPENGETLDQLVARGIISQNTLTLENEPLRRFIRSKVSSVELDAWQQSDGGSVWNTVRVPLATSVAAALAIFGSSAPELTATSAALVPTIAAGVPAILRILLTFAQGSGSKE
jgi:hypothetical protein